MGSAARGACPGWSSTWAGRTEVARVLSLPWVLRRRFLSREGSRRRKSLAGPGRGMGRQERAADTGDGTGPGGGRGFEARGQGGGRDWGGARAAGDPGGWRDRSLTPRPRRPGGASTGSRGRAGSAAPARRRCAAPTAPSGLLWRAPEAAQPGRCEHAPSGGGLRPDAAIPSPQPLTSFYRGLTLAQGRTPVREVWVESRPPGGTFKSQLPPCEGDLFWKEGLCR